MSRVGSVSRLVAAVVLTAALVGACSGTSETSTSAPSTTGEPVEGGELVFGLALESDGFNPLLGRFSNSTTHVARAVMDPLAVMDADNQWQPYLAESFTPNDDFTEWVIRLRPDITFHNGERLDAEALALFLDAVALSPLIAAGMPERPTIEVIDDLSVRLSLTEPWSALPVFFADQQAGYVIAPEQIESGANDTAIGTGPFVFESWQPDSELRVVRNEDYWREDLPHLDSIRYVPLTDPETRATALEGGDVQVAELLDPSAVEALAAEGFRVVDDVDVGSTSVVALNLDEALTSDRSVREALVRGIDRSEFVDVVSDGDAEPADQPYDRASRWHSDVDYPDFDPDRARELVDDYEETHGPIELTLLYISGGRLPPAVGYLQAAWDDIGVDVSLDGVEISAYITRVIGGDYDALYLPGFFGAADPDAAVFFLSSENAGGPTPSNLARYRRDSVDQALEAQRTTADLDERGAEWAHVWDALAEDLPFVFLSTARARLVTAPDVVGFDGAATPEGVPLPAINRWASFPTWVQLSS